MSSKKKILVLDGPAEGKRVGEGLGERWPWVTAFDAATMDYVLGYYYLTEYGYRWDRDSIETGNFDKERDG
jgi:hypothetical protein